MKNRLASVLLLILMGCGLPDVQGVSTDMHLPVPITNNAVALVQGQALSFGGLMAGKTRLDVTAKAFACHIYAGDCREVPSLPDGVGRLASIAVSVYPHAYIFGGYSVAEYGTEISTPDVWQFDVQSETYTKMAPIPVPVDDAVAAVADNRYVYLVSGWHEDDNVDLVQVFDTQEDRWFNATAYPGTPVFGHAGGMAGRPGGLALVICGGVKVVPAMNENARRTFESSNECWRGEIDPNDPAQISWSVIEEHPPALYRMAAMGVEGQVVFAGGTDNPYNYDGIGYNGQPSRPSAQVWTYDAWHQQIYVSPDKPIASMDHRGLLQVGGQYMIIGGMGLDGEVLDGGQVFGTDQAE